ncbi:MAG TPA: hypothetical protein VHF90_01765 [Thermoleophilaceae bacterium]|nr:hypothetical protein [Thermoleophilaceae bacterium]
MGDRGGSWGWTVALAATLAVALSVLVGMSAVSTDAAPSARECRLPDELLAAGETKRARAAYVALLTRNPGLGCAQKGLAKANEPAADTTAKEVEKLCGRGKAKREAHRDDAALKSYEAAIDKDPDAQCAIDGLQQLGPSLPTRAVDWIAEAAPRAVIALAALIAGALLIACFVPRRVARRLGWVPLIGGLLRPQLSLEPLDDEALGDGAAGVGAVITNRIKERLHRFREQALSEQAYDQELDFGTVGDDFADLVSSVKGLDDAISKAGELNDQTKAVAAVLNLVYAALPTTRLTVSGVVEPPGNSSTSATLSLENGSRLEAAFQVSGPAPASPATAHDYLALAEPAAVWVQYEVANALSGGRKVHPDAPESYALTREAIEHQLELRHHQALALYERAIAGYPRNWAAHVGRATVEARLGHFRRSEETLERALADMRGELEDG